ncbi:unnamed protein product [Didymodactylos carnosus]|uniref:Uncharacterized protein n=1 Tax=Didymodactylos carnosus TaxID=1234261 RepID=A0A814RE87_9BILA|nr:unnamed protein product [Didymodactylos carnosus]CAF1132755.1 unnamed protein product [Didymodactylos carnosus]CAF3875345.1 unnamed protein product [Didymodactylos carnosus]CAF3896555.1 unnamed protein product [Didymodactylos carnosus]
MTKCSDNSAALDYSNEIRDQKEQMLSLPIVKVIHSDKSTFIQIYNDLKSLNNNFLQYIQPIKESYMKIATYNFKDGDEDEKSGNGETDTNEKREYYIRAVQCYEDAVKNYKYALAIFTKSSNNDQKNISIYQKKIYDVKLNY